MAADTRDRILIEIEAKDLLSGKLAEIERRTDAFASGIGKTLKRADQPGSGSSVALGPKASKEALELERSLALVTRGLGSLGGAFSSQLGGAGQIVGGITNEVAALGGGLENVIGKAGLSNVALLGLGAGAAGG